MITEKSTYDDLEDKLIVTTTYDNSEVIADNIKARNEASETGRYKQTNSGLVHVGKIHEGDIVRLRNLGYNLYSADKEERKRALLYIQQNEPYLLRMPGKPIAKKKVIWT